MRISDWSSDVCSSDLRAGVAFSARVVVIERMRGGSMQERSVIGSRADFSPERRGFLGATWCSLGNDGSYRLIKAEQYHRSTIGDARYRNICSAVGQIFIAKIGDELRCASRESSHSISTYFSMIYVDIF